MVNYSLTDKTTDKTAKVKEEENGKDKSVLKTQKYYYLSKRYGIDALGAMAQGLFASLLIGTIISTIGEQAGIQLLVDIGGYAKAATGPAMAISIGFALQCPPLVLFHWQPSVWPQIPWVEQADRWQY